MTIKIYPTLGDAFRVIISASCEDDVDEFLESYIKNVDYWEVV